MTLVLGLLITGWVAASIIGTQAYFLGEQSKPIHDRNWKSISFERLSAAIAGKEIDYRNRVPANAIDTYASNNLPTN